MEAAHVSIDGCVKKKKTHNVAYTYRTIPFSLGKEGNSGTHYYLDEP